ncbi:hypothetical protein AVEN_109646-1 [Araneus ventricosus]|uniref:Secreted protein n=1 Tax=Araneus ventricosus TaxID=182803 RepID=A0A4Y2G098_ARAVE|nr:hypothetical protein AVEN_109646-1 [Araneus ventricosus]
MAEKAVFALRFCLLARSSLFGVQGSPQTRVGLRGARTSLPQQIVMCEFSYKSDGSSLGATSRSGIVNSFFANVFLIRFQDDFRNGRSASDEVGRRIPGSNPIPIEDRHGNRPVAR